MINYKSLTQILDICQVIELLDLLYHKFWLISQAKRLEHFNICVKLPQEIRTFLCEI